MKGDGAPWPSRGAGAGLVAGEGEDEGESDLLLARSRDNLGNQQSVLKEARAIREKMPAIGSQRKTLDAPRRGQSCASDEQLDAQLDAAAGLEAAHKAAQHRDQDWSASGQLWNQQLLVSVTPLDGDGEAGEADDELALLDRKSTTEQYNIAYGRKSVYELYADPRLITTSEAVPPPRPINPIPSPVFAEPQAPKPTPVRPNPLRPSPKVVLMPKLQPVREEGDPRWLVIFKVAEYLHGAQEYERGAETVKCAEEEAAKRPADLRALARYRAARADELAGRARM